MTTAQVVDGGFLMKKESAFQEKEQELEECNAARQRLHQAG